MESNPIEGVIFDLDGTLVSSELDFELIRAQIGCPKGVDLLTFVDALPSPYMRDEAMNIIHLHEMSDAQHCEVIQGVEKSLFSLQKANIPFSVVTRNYSKAAWLKIEQCSLPIDFMLTRDDAPAKPDPTALLMAAEHMQVDAEHCVYIGDYLYDILAAKNANMQSCLYAPTHIPDYASRADMLLHHFDDLLTVLGISSLSASSKLA